MNTLRRATAKAVSATGPDDTVTAMGNVLQQQPTTLEKLREFALPGRGAGAQQDSRKVLNPRERAEYVRALKKGYVTFNGCRKKAGSTSSLAKLFQSWCNACYKPNIRLYKATNGHKALDQVVIDISPLAMYNRRRLTEQQQQQPQQPQQDGDKDVSTAVEMDVLQYMAQVHSSAIIHGMVVLRDDDDDKNDDSSYIASTVEMDNTTIDNKSEVDSAQMVLPTRQLLAIMCIGIFQGERSQCRALAKELAVLWEIPELLNRTPEPRKGTSSNDDNGCSVNQRSGNTPMRSPTRHDDDDDDDDRLSSNNGRKRRGTKTKGLSRHRTRGGGHRQSWY
jgi:hypothetical protein